MRPFQYSRAPSPEAAARAGGAEAQFLAGGTTLLDLMKLDVMRPERVVDINPLENSLSEIRIDGDGLRLGALVRMADAADHPGIRRDYPVVAEALVLAASAQLRNMASLGGNLLQRTRCPYFRDTSYDQCNKRNPGSGCAALDGFNRLHAVLGTSDACIASYPGDFAQAAIALDAALELQGPAGRRMLPVDQLHRLPDEDPSRETVLEPGELITAIRIPAGAWTRRSLYVKVRDRESYAFALASAAVALAMEGDTVREARIGLGGVATVPWRAKEAEAALQGERLSEETASRAAEAAFRGAKGYEHNAFKIPLGQQTLVRALLQAGEMEVPS